MQVRPRIAATTGAVGAVVLLAAVLLVWLPNVVGMASADSTITIRIVVPNEVEPTPGPTVSPEPSPPPGSDAPRPAPEPEPEEPEPAPLPRTGADVLPLATAAMAALLLGTTVLRHNPKPLPISTAPRKESQA